MTRYDVSTIARMVKLLLRDHGADAAAEAERRAAAALESWQRDRWLGIADALR